MGKLLLLPPVDHQESQSIEGLIIQVMREARRRAGMTPEGFARAISLRSARGAQVGAGAILAYEDGSSVPVADVYFCGLAVGGFDVIGKLERYLSPDGAATNA